MYPFEGTEKVPIYVFVAHDKQEEYTKQQNPNPHKVVSFREFRRKSGVNSLSLTGRK